MTSGGGIIGVNHVAHLAYARRADEGMARARGRKLRWRERVQGRRLTQGRLCFLGQSAALRGKRRRAIGHAAQERE